MKRRSFVVLVALLIITMIGAVVPGVAGITISQAATRGTWVGQVERHIDHFDYIGSPCPIEAEACIQIVVSYRIVPVTDEAARALPQVAGGAARLEGVLADGDGVHQGTLFVWRVSRVG